MRSKSTARWLVLAELVLLILTVFITRTILAAQGIPVPRLFELFDSLTMRGALLLTIRYVRCLTCLDWIISLCLGLVIGALLPFATLFSPYPFWGIDGGAPEAVLRGLTVTVTTLGGLAVMRSGGPVRFRLVDGSLKIAMRDFGFGALVGIPLAIINIFALKMTGGQPFTLQSPLAALIDAFQPAVVEEAIYRLAFLGLVWWLLNRWWGAKAVPIAAALSVIVHSYAHLDQLLVDNPLFGLGYGAVLAMLWGLPIVLLAIRRSWEAGTGFHWMQDALRFLVGF